MDRINLKALIYIDLNVGAIFVSIIVRGITQPQQAMTSFSRRLPCSSARH